METPPKRHKMDDNNYRILIWITRFVLIAPFFTFFVVMAQGIRWKYGMHHQLKQTPKWDRFARWCFSVMLIYLLFAILFLDKIDGFLLNQLEVARQ